MTGLEGDLTQEEKSSFHWKLTPEQRDFIEKHGMLIEEVGHPRMAGRIEGALLMTEPKGMTMVDLCQILQASKSSISTTIRLLQELGLVERVIMPGDRKEYYRTGRQNVMNMLKKKFSVLAKFSAHLADGTEIMRKIDPNSETTQLLAELTKIHHWLSKEMENLLVRIEEEAIISSKQHTT
jgi:DNA-binding transcriptional regulator GbsR (MarR family)